MAATHAHYIRTIHTSFTNAAHGHGHSSSAWASAASLNNLNLNLNLNLTYNRSPSPVGLPNQNTSINTHNTHMYTHHLRDLAHSPRHNTQVHSNHHHIHSQPPTNIHVGQVQPVGRLPRSTTPADARSSPSSSSPSPPSLSQSLPYPHSPSQSQASIQSQSEMPVRTRRRSASVRGAPPSMSLSLSSRRPSPSPRFDPFADEPIVPVLSLSTEPDHANQLDSERPPNNVPYTIQIPAAQQDEIRQYASRDHDEPPATPRLAPAALPPSPPHSPPASRPLSPTAVVFTPKASLVPSTTTESNSRAPIPSPSPSPPPPRLVQMPPPNLSKVVASILLNRVHAVGKPMRVRRRASPLGSRMVDGHGYVKSCLSSVVSVGCEA